MNTQWCKCCGIDNGLPSLSHKVGCPIRIRDYVGDVAADRAVASFERGYADRINGKQLSSAETSNIPYHLGRVKAEAEIREAET